MHRGRLQAAGSPAALRADLGPTASLEDVFRNMTRDEFDDQGSIRDVRVTRRTLGRIG
jgi:ABC-2 type transport system ATP-binding protein